VIGRGNDAHKPGCRGFYVCGGFGGFDGEEQGVFFDALAVFDVYSHETGFGLIGVQQRHRHGNLAHKYSF
jgi:hypothetical protein